MIINKLIKSPTEKFLIKYTHIKHKLKNKNFINKCFAVLMINLLERLKEILKIIQKLHIFITNCRSTSNLGKNILSMGCK